MQIWIAQSGETVVVYCALTGPGGEPVPLSSNVTVARSGALQHVRSRTLTLLDDEVGELPIVTRRKEKAALLQALGQD